MGRRTSTLGRLTAGCIAAGLLLCGRPAGAEGRADIIDIHGLRLETPGPLHPGVRDGTLARAGRVAAAEAWRRRYPNVRPPHLSDRLIAEAVRHIDLIDETIAADGYAATLDVAVAIDVLRRAAGLPAPAPTPAPTIITASGAGVPADVAPALPPAGIGTGPRWLHIGPPASDSPGVAVVASPLPIGRFVGTGRRHPGLHCLSATGCTGD
ncbi:hypothetical protein [Azospirillum rugosum]|uniref:Uncharacterized protein n=1 Tax=Azospirillum rugosum TaxID=416170 RepID=A0ABS4SMH8_9PROT|nr:hypothetical protein [Azospirillum rugosum]MBP2293773.1 hypothetical protein [Azospirillum rugosum]MDQ0527318.1 hypothetical protein [Azospirillum rugosum]